MATVAHPANGPRRTTEGFRAHPGRFGSAQREARKRATGALAPHNGKPYDCGLGTERMQSTWEPTDAGRVEPLRTTVTRRSAGWAVVLGVVLGAARGEAQCVLAGEGTVTGALPVGSAHRVALRESVRVALTGDQARVQGSAPLAFEAVAPLGGVALYLRVPARWGAVVGMAAGSAVIAEGRVGVGVRATLRDPAGLAVHGVELPCASLSLSPTGTPGTAPIPRHPSNPRYVSHTTEHTGWRCTHEHGSVGCAPVRVSWCQAVGDGSECGFHPRQRTLTVFAAPDEGARVARVTIEATRDILLLDEARRGAWWLVRTHSPSQNALVVRGWVRASDVQWRQEVRPTSRGGLGVYGQAGRAMRRGATRGPVEVSVGRSITDAEGHSWATTTQPWQTEGTRDPSANVVSVELPGGLPGDDAVAQVAGADVRWVDGGIPTR